MRGDSGREICEVTTAGPLCFSGDILEKAVSRPRVEPGDYAILMDSGANTLSLHSRHCSRQSPAVVGFRSIGTLVI